MLSALPRVILHQAYIELPPQDALRYAKPPSDDQQPRLPGSSMSAHKVVKSPIDPISSPRRAAIPHIAPIALLPCRLSRQESRRAHTSALGAHVLRHQRQPAISNSNVQEGAYIGTLHEIPLTIVVVSAGARKRAHGGASQRMDCDSTNVCPKLQPGPSPRYMRHHRRLAHASPESTGDDLNERPVF